MAEFTGIWLPAEFLSISELTLTEKVVASQIVMLSRTRECNAGNEYLAQQLGFSTTAISQALKRLKEKEYIHIDDGKTDGNKRTMYPTLKLLTPLCKNLTEGWMSSKLLSVSILQSLYKMLTKAPQESYRGYISILQSLFKNLTDPYIRTENKIEKESLKDIVPEASGESDDSKKPKGNQIKKPPKYTPDFIIFWEAYQKKSSSKPKAFKEWQRLSGEDKQAALNAIAAYIKFQPDQQYRLDAQGYLSQRKWESEFVESNHKNGHEFVYVPPVNQLS